MVRVFVQFKRDVGEHHIDVWIEGESKYELGFLLSRTEEACHFFPVDIISGIGEVASRVHFRKACWVAAACELVFETAELKHFRSEAVIEAS